MKKISEHKHGSKTANGIAASVIVTVNILTYLASSYWFVSALWFQAVAEDIGTVIFTASILVSLFMLIRHYIIRSKMAWAPYISMNIIAAIHFLGTSGMDFDRWQLWLRAVVFLLVAISALVLAWIAKTNFIRSFNVYLIVSIMTVILNFGGFYGSIYSMYLPYGLESFKIEQDMSSEQAVMPKDFLYYSADAFFGTAISDVSLRYIDPQDLLDADKVASKYKDQYKAANRSIDIVKLFSMLESILFLVYISIIVLNAGASKKDTDS